MEQQEDADQGGSNAMSSTTSTLGAGAPTHDALNETRASQRTNLDEPSSPSKPGHPRDAELNWNALVKHCVKVIESYDPKKATIDSHCEVQLATHKDKVTRKFVQQVACRKLGFFYWELEWGGPESPLGRILVQIREGHIVSP